MIKGILFDLDATLTNRIQSAYEMYRTVVKEEVPDMDEDSLAFETIVQRMMLWDEYGSIEKEHVFSRLKNTFIPHLNVEKWSERWFEEFYKHLVLQDQCKEVLTELKEKYKLGIVTNGRAETQRKKIEFLGLEPYFETILISGEYGVAKPHPEIFLEAAKNLHLEASEIAFVGDTFASDIVGAIQAGMKPIWFSREHLCPTHLDLTQMRSFEEIREAFL